MYYRYQWLQYVITELDANKTLTKLLMFYKLCVGESMHGHTMLHQRQLLLVG